MAFSADLPCCAVARVIEQCCFKSTPDPFNGQTANFTLKPPKVIDSTSYATAQQCQSICKDKWKKNACSFCFCKFIISIFNFLRPFTGSTLKSPILTWNSWGRLWHASLEFCTPKFSILHRLLLINFSFVIWLLNLSYTTTTSTTITILYIILYHYASF